MRKVIAAINMTLDGYCDHTVIDPDEELHNHYTELITKAGVLLYGRITYQLMEYWRPFVEKPSGKKSMDDFAQAIDGVPKIVFSNTLKKLEWKSARLAKQNLKEEVIALKQQSNKDIYACSPSIIVALTQLDLIDEYQLCLHPVIASQGLPLFKNISNRISLKLKDTQTLSSGAVLLYYTPNR